MAYKGKFRPRNIKKYKGNPTTIIYRSMLERRFMDYCDTNSAILVWCSEGLAVPYISPIDRKWHRYFPDFWIRTKSGCTLIEVKPLSETKAPRKRLTENLNPKANRRYIKNVKVWGVNEAKWTAAKKVCEEKGWEWKLLTEKELNPNK